MNPVDDRRIVVYIEDSPINARLMERIFVTRLSELRLVIAVDGTSGLQALAEHEPSLLLLDFHLPDMTGLDVLRTARGRGHAVPVIAVTADARPELIDSMLTAGAAAVVTKPFDFAALLGHIHACISLDSSAS